VLTAQPMGVPVGVAEGVGREEGVGGRGVGEVDALRVPLEEREGEGARAGW
jgi:hypothetical protein